jgi:hypothetical protein
MKSTHIKNHSGGQGVVVHVCNPSYMGGGGGGTRIMVHGWLGKSLRPYLKHKLNVKGLEL